MEVLQVENLDLNPLRRHPSFHDGKVSVSFYWEKGRLSLHLIGSPRDFHSTQGKVSLSWGWKELTLTKVK